MTPEPRLEARCDSAGCCSPKKRRNTGSLSSGWRCVRTSLLVKMFTTDGVARRTASLYEPMLATVGSGPAEGAWWITGAAAEPLRAGSHSGRKVETTNRIATATVAACAKMIQRRYIYGEAERRLVYEIPLQI